MGYFGVESQKHLGGYIIGGDSNTYAPEIWDWMINHNIKSVIDVGCGEGHSTKYFYDNGCEVLGVEGGINAINNSKINFIGKERLLCSIFIDLRKEKILSKNEPIY
jgi:16S rRNA A1518/A1519 N6-dimethyltransferase RsmA/KsgA/DIM1 with predicted DNA glycosylase/AP lyase activity